jgi:signal-transduction protein with cAMP-binding, CBS, and nucleotidyltransferase domain
MNTQTDLPSVLARTRLFASLKGEALELLASICSHRHYDAQQRLFAEGDLGGELFIVLSGRIKANVETEDGEVILNTFGPGDVFGESLALQFVEDQLLTMNQKIYAAFDQDFAAFQRDERVLSLERYVPIGRQLMLVEAEWQALVDK